MTLFNNTTISLLKTVLFNVIEALKSIGKSNPLESSQKSLPIVQINNYVTELEQRNFAVYAF